MKSRFIFFDASCMNRSLLRQINKRHLVRGNFFLHNKLSFMLIWSVNLPFPSMNNLA